MHRIRLHGNPHDEKPLFTLGRIALIRHVFRDGVLVDPDEYLIVHREGKTLLQFSVPQLTLFNEPHSLDAEVFY